MKTWRDGAFVVLLLAAFAAVAYGPALGLPFIGDDYVFLDETRDATFASLWSFEHVLFGWYRPWSRELHFWSLQKAAGLHEVAYRAFGVVLWILGLALYAAVVRRLASTRVAAIATIGAASLALWGVPLLWISGSQDLWLLFFAMATLLTFMKGHRTWSLMPLVLALLSKETAAILPALLVAYLLLVERRRLADALRQVAPHATVVMIWLLVHPTLRERLIVPQHPTAEVLHRPAPPIIAAKTVLSTLNLDLLPSPREFGWGDILRTSLSALVLVVGAVLATRRRSEADRRTAGDGLIGFAIAWMLLGWLPLLVPSIAWHAYYGCLGALGAWLLLALGLQHRPKVVVALVASLAILRGAAASTPSWDWGNEWYQRRAGSILASIREDLQRQHPSLPPHSRLYFASIPNNIGFVAGRSPAVRVWYQDSTLEADFYSSYHARPPAFEGEDFFFRFDTLRGMVELKPGPENTLAAREANPHWENDHQNLAMLFLKNADVRRAAVEFEKLSELSHRPDAAGFAGVCWEQVGDTARADSLFSGAKSRMRLPDDQFLDWVQQLRATLPVR